MKKIAIGDKRFVITKNLIMMLVMLVVIFVAIFAWYSNNDTVTASGTQISAKGADNVELALPTSDGKFPTSNDDWKSELDFAHSGYLKNLVKDITSNGKQFAVPTFEAAKGLKDGRKVIADDVWTEGLSSRVALTNESTLDDDQYNYISFDFYIRSKQQNINVTSESFLAAGSEIGYQDDEHTEADAKPLKGDSIYRCSSYGAQEGTANAFSSDAIVGAMRVSLVGCLVDGVNSSGKETTYNGGTWDANSDLRFLWLPRPDVYLETDNDSNNWKLFTGIKPSYNAQTDSSLTAEQIAELNNIAAQTYCHSFYEGNTVTGDVKKTMTPHKYNDTVVKAVDGAETNSVFKVSDTRNDAQLGATGHTPTLGQSARITGEPEQANLDQSKQIQFTAGTEQGDNRDTTGYYVYKYTLNIWIEGEDAEARRSMNNGVFSLELDFGT